MTDPRVSLRVAGIPAPKGSRTPGRRKNGTIYTRPASAGEKSWTEVVAYSARANRPAGKTLEPPYEVELTFFMPRPDKPSWEWPSKCDTDKLVRCVLDGLVDGKLLVDDRHVVKLIASKQYSGRGAAGVAVVVR
jgi:Holliday junction resolvase RusA-like endonuclease